MTVLSPAAIHAVMVQATGGGNPTIYTAIALAESGGQVDRVVGDRRGLWMINDSRGFDRNLMVTDAAYAARKAWEISRQGRSMSVWPTYNNGRYRDFLNAAKQAAAQAANINGSILAEDGSYVPASFYANSTTGQRMVRAEDGSYVPASFYAATNPMGSPLAANVGQPGPLTGLRITGTEVTGDFSSNVIGDATYSAGWTTVPNIQFTLADEQGDLLWQQRNLWVRGARVTYMDLDMRIDEIEFAPGSHGTGQLTITAIDGIVYQLQLLRGARTAKGVSPTDWIRQELRLIGIDPNVYFLGEQMPSQSEIARDIPDQEGSTSNTEVPSAWTTITRLAKETGKRVFISGRKLVFGSAAFAMQWTSPGDLRIGWHNSPEGERWQNLPSGKQTSVGDRSGVTEVSGTVPQNRAMYFRPGVSVIVHNTPSIAAGDRRFVCTEITHTLAHDVDGAEVQLIEPIELKPEAKT